METLKIAFTGPESSGKTSLSKHVAEKLNATWFDEYARTYLSKRDGKYTFDDIFKMAVHQHKERLKNQSKGISIYDTENLVFYVWSIYKYQKCAPLILDYLNQQSYHHYFLCSPKGIAWEEDPLREHPEQREELFEMYLSEIKTRNWDYTILEGNFEERVNTVLQKIEHLISL